MLENSQFHCLADAYLDAISDEIDAKDEDAAVDADLQQGVLAISLLGGQQYGADACISQLRPAGSHVRDGTPDRFGGSSMQFRPHRTAASQPAD